MSSSTTPFGGSWNCAGPTLGPQGREVVGLEPLAIHQQHRAFDGVPELANVAGRA
jgi:hypothetical protein